MHFFRFKVLQRRDHLVWLLFIAANEIWSKSIERKIGDLIKMRVKDVSEIYLLSKLFQSIQIVNKNSRR